MQANIRIGFTQDHKGLIISYEYPKGPHAHTKDNTYVNGQLFGKERIVDFKKGYSGDFTLITERDEEVGNEHKKATLRLNYTLNAKTYSVVKDVKFDGTDKWIIRNEYLLNRTENQFPDYHILNNHILAASFDCKWSQTAQGDRNVAFFFVYHRVSLVASFF